MKLMRNNQLALKEAYLNSYQTLLKWPGNKTQLLKVLINATEEYRNFENYYEPFFGSGAFYFFLKRNQKINKKAFLNDYLEELILFYKTIKNPKTIEKIIIEIDEVLNKYNSLEELQDKKEMYLTLREKYNSFLNKDNLTQNQVIKQSALLYVINKTCFNGVYRKSKKGKFNVPHGRRVGNSQSINFGEQQKEYFRITKKLLHNTQLTSTSYVNVLKAATEKDFVYLDPPYVDNFTDYTSEGFNDNDFSELDNTIKLLTDGNVKFLMSNSNTNRTQEIFHDKRLYCYEVGVTRTIDRSSSYNTGATTELLISNYKLEFLGKSIW
jgi:DNA adenine methylase